MENLFVGESAFALGLPARVARLGPLMDATLITGETGTGKSLLAEMIHNASGCNGALVHLDCTAIPPDLVPSELFGCRLGAFTGARHKPGMVCQASGGTLWLDEIGDMPLETQSQLLTMLDGSYRPVGAVTKLQLQARVVVTTNHDLAKMVQEGKFRRELYYRISTLEVAIPPIHSRPEDVLPILRHLVRRNKSNKGGRIVLGVEGNSLARLTNFSWPGNVRQMNSMVSRAMVEMEGELSTRDIAAQLPAKREPVAIDTSSIKVSDLKGQIRARRQEMEKEIIEAALQMTKGSRKDAAMILGISVRTLIYKIKQYEINIVAEGVAQAAFA